MAPDAPRPLQLMAARGILPGAKPEDIVTMVALLCASGDAELAETARRTLAELPKPVLLGALGTDLQSAVLDRLLQAHATDPAAVELGLRQPHLDGATLERLAERATEQTGELIATNEELMLAHPRVIEKLYMNKSVRMSTADRLIELAVRNHVNLDIPAFDEAAQAITQQLIPEPTAERTFDDELFTETEAVAAATELAEEGEDTHELDEEGKETLKERFLPLHVQMAQLTVTQKIRRATLGTAAERLMLARDHNRLVAVAAVKSPRMRENEVVQITASRSVADEVLRVIALNRELTRSYQVKYNLVTNPRTPFTFVSRLIPHLRDADLRSLSRSKNVTGTVAQAITQQISRKQQTRRS